MTGGQYNGRIRDYTKVNEASKEGKITDR
jgi:hypothetical protein